MSGALLIVLSGGAFLQCLDSATLPPNPCPNMFQYQQDKNGDVFARVMLDNDYSGNYSFSVNMSIAAYLVDEQNMKADMESTTDDIVAGRLLVYNITFPFQSVIPRLTRIELNKKVYCSGPPEEFGPSGVTDMFAAIYYRINLPSKRRDKECGLSMVNTQDLVNNEEDFVDGQFPWLVAIRYRRNLDWHYICTGSLVSYRHVITAGHCVRNSAEVDNYLLSFGKKSVSSWDRADERELQTISVHPDYNAKKDADIAILTVKEQIEFKADIKPLCLSHEEEYMNRMEGMQGIVVGWWTDRKRKQIDAKKIVFSIVSQTECNMSSSISSVVTSRTFCAGLKGADPCHGDSGAGFAIQKDGRWFLKGVASTAVGDLDVDSCYDDDFDNYFVFVDLDKVMSWLKKVIT